MQWHRGFLTVAEAMEKPLTQGIAEFIRREGPIASLLFSGHSAGGAVAQIFYAMSMSPRYHVHDTITGTQVLPALR